MLCYGYGYASTSEPTCECVLRQTAKTWALMTFPPTLWYCHNRFLDQHDVRLHVAPCPTFLELHANWLIIDFLAHYYNRATSRRLQNRPKTNWIACATASPERCMCDACLLVSHSLVIYYRWHSRMSIQCVIQSCWESTSDMISISSNRLSLLSLIVINDFNCWHNLKKAWL